MSGSFLRFPSHDNPPLLNFSFSNPNTAQSKRTHDQSPASLDSHNYSTSGALTTSNNLSHAVSSENFTPDQPLFKSPKPGPPATEPSSGTNAFKLGAKKSQHSSKSSNNALLRQEVFKSAHTLAPPQSLNTSPDGIFPSAPRTPALTLVPLKPSNKPSSKIQPPAPSSSIKFEPSPLLSKPSDHDNTGPDQDWSTNHLDQNAPDIIREREASATSDVTMLQPASHGGTAGATAIAASCVPLHHSPGEPTLAPKTPSRHSVDRRTPMVVNRFASDHQGFKYLELEGQLNTANQKVTILKNELEEREKDKAAVEKEVQALESQLTDARADIDDLLSQLEAVRLNGVAIKQLHLELATLRQDAHAIEKSYAAAEEKHKQLREILSEYQTNCEQLENSLRQQQGVSDLLREELSQVRGSYSESLELNSELRGWLNSMSSDQTEMSKSLAELHKQIEDQTVECLELRTSDIAATERVKTLELNVSSLTSDNIRIQSLLTENEQAFAKKLKLLEEDNDVLTRNLEIARADLKRETAFLTSLRSSHEESLVQIDIHHQEEHEAKERLSQLAREMDLKSRTLDEASRENELLTQRLAEAERNLSQAGAENGVLQGRITELDKIYSICVKELKASQDKLAQLNSQLSTLQQKFSDASSARDKVNTLQGALSTIELKSQGQTAEIAHFKQQLAEAKEGRNAYTAERDSLLGAARAAEEREAQFQRELQNFRSQVGLHQKTSQQASVQLMEAQGLRQVAELKLQDLSVTLENARASQKVKTQGLEAEVKRLGDELSTSLSAKATLEGVLSSIQASSEQELSSRRGLEQKITFLTDRESEQKIKISLLEQQIAATNARSLEHKSEASTYRSDAEAARASIALVEYRLKEKELELGNWRSKVQALEAASAESTMVVNPDSEARIVEQAQTIENLNSTIANMHKDVDTILERYRDGKLVESEKNFLTEVTTGLMQEKNKVMNNLRGEVKRKDNEIASNKATIATQKQSMANYIGQIDTLKKQLEELEGDVRSGEQSGLRGIMLEMHQLPSSSLSEAPAPDHDEPAPDTPTVSSKPSKSTAAPVTTRQAPLLDNKQKPQQYRTFAEMERDHNHAVDEIQDFEEQEPARSSGSGGRKRHAADIEPTEDAEGEQTDNRRKGTTRTKKTAKVGESGGTKDAVNARGKTGKRRKP